MKLVLNGKPLQTKPIPSRVLKVKNFLDGQRDGVAFTMRELERRLGYGFGSIAGNGSTQHPSLKGYSIAITYHKVAYAKPKTIEQIRKALDEANEV